MVRCFVFSLRPLTSEISPWRTWPVVNSSPCSSASAPGLSCNGGIASFGCGCPGVGRIGTGALVILRPETVVAWHRKGFRLFWTWISRRKRGRPEVNPAMRALILKMAAANPLWGAPRIHGELLKLGILISERTVSRILPRSRTPPFSDLEGVHRQSRKRVGLHRFLYRAHRHFSGSVRFGGFGPSSAQGDSF